MAIYLTLVGVVAAPVGNLYLCGRISIFSCVGGVSDYKSVTGGTPWVPYLTFGGGVFQVTST